MFQKLVLAAAFCATASFATWDKFPVLENHKGEIVVGAEFIKQGEPMKLVPYISSRYTVMPNLLCESEHQQRKRPSESSIYGSLSVYADVERFLGCSSPYKQ